MASPAKPILISVSIAILAAPVSLSARPFIPATDEQVLERLPLTAASTGSDLRALRKDLSTNPGRLDLAVKLAQRYIAIGKAEADPRFYGYAQGVLQPWWNAAEPPSEVLLLRATILQNRHDFDNALHDLELLLQRDPHNAQAWLAQAVILQVRARYDEAKRSCLKLIEFKDTMPAITCLSNVSSLTGQADKSFELLHDTLANALNLSDEQRSWSLTVLAEMAVRMGKHDEAEQFFSEALKINQQDVYLLTSYADFLLDRGKPAQVIALLSNKRRIDALLLRLALAKQQLSAADLREDIATLEARFAASRLRGESLHQGDEARLALFLLKRPEEALRLAQENWQAQREPRDARILLEAALAAQRPAAAQPVLELLATTGMEDNYLRKLAARFGND